MLDLVVVGHLLKEKIIFPDGREIGPVLGSPAAYASVAAARLGLKVGIVTKIGKDMPEELLKVFKEVAVDTEGVKTGNNTTADLLIYEKSGNKKIEFLKKAEDIESKDIPAKYLNSKFFLICPIDYEVPKSLMKFLYQKGKRLSMELSGFGGASSGKNGKTKEEKIKLLKRITKYFEIVKGGKEDCQCLFPSSYFSSPLSGEDEGEGEEKNIAKKIIEWGASISIITSGKKGALVASRHCEERDSSPVIANHSLVILRRSRRISLGTGSAIAIPSFPAKVVDCTGAGDVWHAGFLAEYLKGKDLYNSALFASACSSLLIEKSGGVKKERFPISSQVYERSQKLKKKEAVNV